LLASLAQFRDIVEIAGDILRVRVPQSVLAGSTGPCLGDRAVVVAGDGEPRAAEVIELRGDVVTVQVFGGTRGVASDARVRFLGRVIEVPCSTRILGRVLRGTGEVIDGGPSLQGEDHVAVAGSPVNPVRRQLASRMIRTGIPMIDLFNSLVESQKISVFTTAGEPHARMLAGIAAQADADVVVFGGLGLAFDDYLFFRERFEASGVLARTVMFVNLASDPVAERVVVPDMALAAAERFALLHGRRVLVLLTDMTAFADALKEIGVALERIPANRGYPGDLYTQLARRYERACDFAGSGTITVLSVTTMPADDVTHPVPDNTGYITEGQYYLHGGLLDPFGSLSRLKQFVIGRVTREDHNAIMNALVGLYAEAQEARAKQAMAFDLSERDHRCLRFGELFRDRFMRIDVDIPLEDALDLGWRTLAECFSADELLVKRDLIQRYYPRQGAA
jgi:V/A-type H+-transporting ATPase subunit B